MNGVPVVQWPAGSIPSTREGEPLLPPGAPLEQAEAVLRRQLNLGQVVGLRDAGGRWLAVVPGQGMVVNETMHLDGLSTATVFTVADARFMALLWRLAAEVAEQREAAAQDNARDAGRP